MILQALTEYYEALSARGEISPPGWGESKISFALYINQTGELERIISMQTEQARGKKTVLAPQLMSLPATVPKGSGIAPKFLWGNSGYILGTDNKGKPKRTADCFAACKELHHAILDSVDSTAARALLAFFDKWKPEDAGTHPVLTEYLEDILSGVNLVFRCESGYIHNDTAIRQAWERHYNNSGDGPEAICLVTGERVHPENVHPSIKNVAGAQSSGAALVSFNAPAFCSYGKEQNLNAPTGKYAAFAYTTALNHLLAKREHVCRIGDTTVVFWAKESGYHTFFSWAFFGETPPAYETVDLRSKTKALCSGQSVEFDEQRLDPDMDFYILGLAPNAARLSVRFFMHNSFGQILSNVQAHYDRLEIVRPGYDKFETIPVWKLLEETVNKNTRDKNPVPNLSGEVLRAVLNNTHYPATLLNGVTLRIRADREITRGRAAIIKAYYLKYPHPDIPKEVLTVSLNPESTNPAYNLGRLFSVLEAIQDAANPGINTTIRDKYFSSASATPGSVFPGLINLAQKHLRKLEGGLRVHYDKLLTELMSKLPETYPARMNLPQQGSFQLGYYHQTQSRYMKKEEN